MFKKHHRYLIPKSISKLSSLFFLVVGCSLLPSPTGTSSKYILTGASAAPVSKKSDKELVVMQPTLSAALQDHNRVVYQPTPQKVEYLAGGEWAQKLDLMIWETLFDTLKASRKFKSVVADTTAAVDSDYTVLKTHVSVFGVDQIHSQRQAHVVYEFTLIGKDNALISQKRIDKTVPIQAMDLDAIVAQLNKAHQMVVQQFIQTA